MQISQRKLQYDCCMTVLDIARDVLYKRIDSRVDDMFERGLTKEVDALLEEGISFDGQSMQAIGYKEFRLLYEKKITEDEVKEKIKQNSRNYAKRQITWLKKYEFAKWFDSMTSRNEAREYILENLR